jgi:hypothetical protein
MLLLHEMVFPEPGAVVEFRRRGVGSPGNRNL